MMAHRVLAWCWLDQIGKQLALAIQKARDFLSNFLPIPIRYCTCCCSACSSTTRLLAVSISFNRYVMALTKLVELSLYYYKLVWFLDLLSPLVSRFQSLISRCSHSRGSSLPLPSSCRKSRLRKRKKEEEGEGLNKLLPHYSVVVVVVAFDTNYSRYVRSQLIWLRSQLVKK